MNLCLQSRADGKAKARLRAHLWYWENRTRALAKGRAYRKSNPELMRRKNRQKYIKSRGKILARNRRWRIQNPEATAALNRKHCQLGRQRLDRNYVLKTLVQGTNIKRSSVPEGLIELQRARIQLMREHGFKQKISIPKKRVTRTHKTQ